MKVGDRVRLKDYTKYADWFRHEDEAAVIVKKGWRRYLRMEWTIAWSDGEESGVNERDLIFLSMFKEVSMPPMYLLKKETPELKKGAVLEPKGCLENGDYKYYPKDEDVKYEESVNIWFPKDCVEKQPEWFEKVELVPVPSNKMDQVKKILKIK